MNLQMPCIGARKKGRSRDVSKRALLLVLFGLVALGLLVWVLETIVVRLGLEAGPATAAMFAGLAALALYAAIMAGAYVLVRRAREEGAAHALSLADVDGMDGQAFEEYVARLLRSQGYRVSVVGAPGDLGVDLIAEKAPNKYAVQVKRQCGPVSRRAVSDAVAGRAYYHCNGAMVVTSAHFTNGAFELARSNNCQLVDRKALARWVLDFQKRNQG